MKNYHLAMWAAAGLGVLCSTLALGSESPKTVPTRLSDALPAPVYRLFTWPGSDVLEGPKRVPDDSPGSVYPDKNARAWIDKVLAPDWLPSNIQLIRIRDEFDDRDVVRAQWLKNGYGIQVAQTSSIFTLKLEPAAETVQLGTNDLPGKLRDLMREIFASSVERRDSQGAVLEIKELNEKIASTAVSVETITVLPADGAILSDRMPIDDNSFDLSDATNLQAGDWFGSEEARAYWFRRIHWWTDGRTIGFFFLKVEGGAWFPTYIGNIDAGWFRSSR